ncbi:MAG TPA: hypothetical protein VFQ69_10480 [Rhizomicrobium sp.]|jgi:hypothetical protein|nr:hypothetical protein [Rhizomicrobium sp.]
MLCCLLLALAPLGLWAARPFMAGRDAAPASCCTGRSLLLAGFAVMLLAIAVCGALLLWPGQSALPALAAICRG